MITNPTLERIKEGMSIYDSKNTEIGKVEFVQFGTEDFDRTGPESATSGVDLDDDEDTFFESMVVALTEDSRAPKEVREMLLRIGYLKIERGFLKKDAFVILDNVTSVTEDGVYISLSKDDVSTL